MNILFGLALIGFGLAIYYFIVLSDRLKLHKFIETLVIVSVAILMGAGVALVSGVFISI